MSLLATTASAAPGVAVKQAEAEQVLAEISQIDADLGLAVDAYNAAELKLAGIKAEQGLNAGHLRIARSNYRKAQRAIADRLTSLYTQGEATLLEVLLGSTSLDEILDRIDTVNRVSQQDSRIVHEISGFRKEIAKRGKQLKRQRAEQKRLVAERASRRAWIEGQLRERERLLASIQDEIARLEAEEAARQRRLEAQARARLDAQSQPVSSDSFTQSFASNEALPAAPPARYGGVVGIAMQYLGTPYVWAGASPGGFDCSGFVMYVYAQIGVSLPHNAAMQYGYGTPVSRDQLEPGDLVFFNGLGHDGIYIGGGQFIHSPHTGDVVKISSLSDSWYAATYVGAKRL